MDSTNSSIDSSTVIGWTPNDPSMDPQQTPLPKMDPCWCLKRTHLIHTPDNGSHGGISRSIDSSTVIGWTPRGWIDVNQIGFMAHGIGLNQISHVRLVKHSDPGYHGVISDPSPADPVVAGPWDLPSTPGSMAVKPVIGVSGVGIGVIATEVITGSCVLKKM